jgi:tRNA(Ile)-lysidine synthase
MTAGDGRAGGEPVAAGAGERAGRDDRGPAAADGGERAGADGGGRDDPRPAAADGGRRLVADSGGRPGAAAIEAAVRAGGLLAGPVVVLLSGGRDSTCLLDLAVRVAGAVSALHVNYGLRDAAGDDEAHCAALCERLGVELAVRRPNRPEDGNVQAWARDQRYAAAAQLALARGARVAAGHTATDQVETVLYRLAASPGRRALLGMPARSGRLVRPLLAFTREDTAAYCTERGLPWREDASNADYVRGRIRHGLVPLLRELHPAAEANVLRTLALLRDEAQVLDAAVDAALAAAGDPPDLSALPAPLARLALQRLADRAAGGRAPALAAHADAVLALTRDGTVALDLPGGLRAVSEYGRLRIERPRRGSRGDKAAGGAGGGAAAVPAPARLAVPGRADYGGGELTCERGGDIPIADGTLAAGALAATLEVRAWRPGDRMRPLGLGGSRSLQDLFTDRKVPRSRRHALPVVVSDGEIAWVPGVATGERFRVTARTGERVRLAWREAS